MAKYSWKLATSGDWATASAWRPSGPPNATTADVVIGVSGSYVVTVDSGATYSLDSLTISDSGATLDLGGELVFAGARKLTLSAGTLNLTGTIKGAIVANTGGVIHFNSGTLDRVTYRGALDLTAYYQTVTVICGITLTGASGTGAGAVNLGFSQLFVAGTQTLDNATVTMSVRGGFGYGLFGEDPSGAGSVLTLGAHLVARDSDFFGGYAGGALADAGTPGSSLVNKGTILADTSGGYFQISGNSFANEGSISVSHSDSLYIISTSFRNCGTIIVAAGSLFLNDAWTSTGKIIVTNGGTLQLGDDTTTAWGSVGSISATSSTVNLYGQFTTAKLTSLALSNDTVSVYGDLVNTGATLSVGAGSDLGTIGLRGTITGGVLAESGAGLTFNNATLDGVTCRGTLDLSANTQMVYVTDGITLTGASGTGAGAVTLGVFSSMYVVGATTLNNATITISTYAIYGGGLFDYDPGDSGATLTLGANLIIRDSAASGYAGGNLVDGGYRDDGLINQGKILLGTRGGYFRISGNRFTNQGTIAVSNGDSLTINSTSFTNLSGATLTGGSYSVSGASTLELDYATTLVRLNASVTLSGAGSVIETTNNGATTLLEASLTTIGASGALSILGGRGFTTTKTLTDNGRLALHGGTLISGGALTVGSGGTFSGYGIVKPAIADAGTIDARGGLLKLSGSVSGAGALRIENAATLELAAASSSVTFAASAVASLRLDAQTQFTGAIGGLALGDAIVFSAETVSSAVISGSTLTVTGSAGTVSYQVAGALGGNHFAVQADNHTIKLVAGSLAPSPASFMAPAATAEAGSEALAGSGATGWPTLATGPAWPATEAARPWGDAAASLLTPPTWAGLPLGHH